MSIRTIYSNANPEKAGACEAKSWANVILKYFLGSNNWPNNIQQFSPPRKRSRLENENVLQYRAAMER